MADSVDLPQHLQRILEEVFFRSSDAVHRASALRSLLQDHPGHRDAIVGWCRQIQSSAPAVVEQEVPVIANHELKRKIGEGGFGEVWLAEQLRPVARAVAVKVLKLGMDSAGVLRRFSLEQEALARMGHHAIARLFEAGMTVTGRPYFSMEYVDGVPITRFCRDRRMSIESRIALLVEVCDAVHHAHEKGVVHRDLNPGNILVCVVGSRPCAKVIDFGIARAVTRDGDSRFVTETGVVLGTGKYMSPEQARGESDVVDARTDVFALGKVLLDLLQDDECVHGEDDGAASKISGKNGTSRVSWRSSYDLTYVVNKATEHEAGVRYSSVAELAADLCRFLRSEAVIARAPGVGYRLRKFLVRNRAGVLTAVCITVAWLAGIALSRTWSADEMVVSQSELESLRSTRAVLASVERANVALAAYESLFPAEPDRIAEIESWLRDYGEPASHQLENARARLRSARGKAAPPPVASEIRASILALQEKIAFQRDQLAVEGDAARRAAFESGLQELEDQVECVAHRFADPADTQVHASLVRLVRKLEIIAGGSLDGARAALAVARRHAQLDVELAERWSEAIAAIAASDDVRASASYEHLRISPQFGLVPIGMNTDTKLWEFAHVDSAEVDPAMAARGAGRGSGAEWSGIVFVLIPVSMAYRIRHREVAIRPYFLAKHELTESQALRLGLLRTAPRGSKTDRMPVTNVSWWSCHTNLERWGLALPTRVQWEHACRGGTGTSYWTGESIEDLRKFESLDSMVLEKVGSRGVNPFGLCDMAGNVCEWCADSPGRGAMAEGTGLRIVEKTSDQRVVCGGWGGDPQGGLRSGRSSSEYSMSAGDNYAVVGVRPARALKLGR